MFAARRPIVSSISAAATSSAARQRAYSRMTIIGRIGREPAVFKTNGGEEGLHLFVASSNRDQQQTTSWYRVSSYASGPRKDYIKALPKGSLIHVECDARLRHVSQEQGTSSMYLDLVERHISLLSKPKSAFQNADQAQE